jgi:DNA helicase TIP49 (TBP-interacting protein)
MMLSDAVAVARRFQRSVRVDADLGAPAALHGFVCQGSGSAALKTMCRLIIDGGQRAFTWTGPYGSGKSSLAVALAAAVGCDTSLCKAARDLLCHLLRPATRTKFSLMPP